MLRFLLIVSACLFVSGDLPLAAQTLNGTEVVFKITGGIATNASFYFDGKTYYLDSSVLISDLGTMKYSSYSSTVHGIFANAKKCVKLELGVNRKSTRSYYSPTETFVIPLPPNEPIKTCEFSSEVFVRLINKASPENPATITVVGSNAKKHTFIVEFEGESVWLPHENAWHKQ